MNKDMHKRVSALDFVKNKRDESKLCAFYGCLQLDRDA